MYIGMKPMTAYFFLFVLLHLHIMVSAVKCKDKYQTGKEAEGKGKTEEENPAEEKRDEGKQAQDKPAQEKATEEKPAEDKPTPEKQADEKPTPEKAAEEKTAHEKSQSNKKGEENLSNKKEEHAPKKKPCKKNKKVGANGAKHKSSKQFSESVSLPVESNYPNGIGRLPSDANSPGQPDQAREDLEMGYNGHLYDLFQKRLNIVFRELYHNVNSPPVTQPTPQMEYDDDRPQKRSAVSNCLYEEFKRRLDKFNNEFLEPAKAIKRTSKVNRRAGEKRSTVQENLYEEYKRRLDKLDNDLWLDGGKAFDRSGRGTPTAGIAHLTMPLKRVERKPKRSDNDKVAVVPDFYEEYKKKLDHLTRELYQKSNERIARTYSDLTEQDLISPTLQRLVSAVQLDDAKSVTSSSRDNSGNFEGSTMLLKIDKAIDNLDKQPDKRSLGNFDLGSTIFGADSLNYMTGTVGPTSTGTSAVAAASASYPAVLTKSVDANLGMLGNTAPKNLLATVATKMNMTTLDLAKKLAAMSNPLDYVTKKDPQLGEEMQKFINLAVNQINSNQPAKKASVNEVSIISGLPLLAPDQSGVPKPLLTQDAAFNSIPSLVPSSPAVAAANAAVAAASARPHPPPTTEPPCDDSTTKHSAGAAPPTTNPPTSVQPTPAQPRQRTNDLDASRIAGVLDKVLGKLEVIQSCKAMGGGGGGGGGGDASEETCEADGVPCDVVGSWNSNQMGLRFDISLNKAADRRLGAAEKNNKLLSIEVGERVPPRAHHLIDTSWKFMGSALNQQGGPFYIYSQNRELGIVTTFIGYCRVCGDIDTIFGSWTIMSPSKDCEDVTTALENRRDIFRRYNMENKRNRHFKDMLFERSKYAKSECES